MNAIDHGSQIWHLAHLLRPNGIPCEVRGSPRVTTGPGDGKAVAFDGRHDALILPSHPLIGATSFTIEAILRVNQGGPAEQRLLHLQSHHSSDRALLETRTQDPSGVTWFADTIVSSGGTDSILADPARTHTCGAWHSLALVCDGRFMHQFVDGQFELSALCNPQPLPPGSLCLGMRLNHVTPFYGEIAAVRLSRFARLKMDLWSQPLASEPTLP